MKQCVLLIGPITYRFVQTDRSQMYRKLDIMNSNLPVFQVLSAIGMECVDLEREREREREKIGYHKQPEKKGKVFPLQARLCPRGWAEV